MDTGPLVDSTLQSGDWKAPLGLTLSSPCSLLFKLEASPDCVRSVGSSRSDESCAGGVPALSFQDLLRIHLEEVALEVDPPAGFRRRSVRLQGSSWLMMSLLDTNDGVTTSAPRCLDMTALPFSLNAFLGLPSSRSYGCQIQAPVPRLFTDLQFQGNLV